MRELTLGQVEHLALRLAQKMMEWDEPIPDFETRFPGRLESCLKTPFQTYGGKALYQGVEAKSAILFYLMIKNHPFQNGNKRIAVIALLSFLHANGKWLNIHPEDLYGLAVWVAESRPIAKDGAVLAIRDMIRKYIVKR